jgi:hypothetical protein
MNPDPQRLLRLRWSEALDLGARVPRAAEASALAPRGTPRFVGRVVNGGAMPSQTGQVYLVNPVRLGGVESEGTTASVSVDTTRTIPVVVIGETPPEVGDLLIAMAVGGRWVASAGGAPLSFACSPCPIPKKNLTVSWANVLTGNGSTTLVFTAPAQWNSACSHQLLYSLSCPGGQIQFAVTYFLSGSCPGGQKQSCVSPGHNPFALILTSSTCSPFFLRYAVTSQSCAVLGNNGYSSFTITE